MIYYFVLLFIFLFCVLNVFKNDKGSSVGFICIVFPVVILFAGLRLEVGTDWFNYRDIFNNTNYFTFDNPIEPLFSLFILASKSLINSYSFFIFSLFLISFAIKLNVFVKYSILPLVSILLYIPVLCLVYDINGLRQGIAIGITLCSLGAIVERKLIKFILINILAIGFHYSAIIFLPFYLLGLINIKRNVRIALIILSIFVGFLSQSLIQNFVSNYFGGLDSVLADKVFSYYGNESYGMGLVFNFSSIHRLLIFFLFLFYYERIQVEESLKKIFLNGYFISICLYFLFSAIEIVATRGTLYYRCLDVLIIPCFITIPKSNINKLIITLIVFIYVCMQVTTTLKIPDNFLIPYKNILIEYMSHG